MGSEIKKNDIFTRLTDMGCNVTPFDVAEMIEPRSLWELPLGWRQLLPERQKLPEIVVALAQSHTIFVSPQSFQNFSPTAIASAFRIEGDIDASNLFAGLKDPLPDHAINEHMEARLLVYEPEYICAELRAQFTAEHDGKVMDFESITLYDLYFVTQGSHILLQRTIVTPLDDPALTPLFSDARPPQ
jgi:hypothetical protein